MMGAGIATHNVAFQVIGVIASIVFVVVYLITRNNDKASQLSAQMAARQGVTPDMLILEYNDLINAYLFTFSQSGTGMSREQITAMAMNEAPATLMKKYGYSPDELGSILAVGL